MGILRSPTAFAIVLLLVAGPGYAQRGPAGFHLGGGLVLPQGKFDDAFTAGWQAMAGARFGLEGIPFLVRVDGYYGESMGDESQVGPDVKTSFFGGLLGGQYNLGNSGSASVLPYLLGQAGITHVKLHVGQLDVSEDKFTFAGGAGVMFTFGSLRLFVEGKYMPILTSNTSTTTIPIVVGLRFGGNR